MMTGLHGLCLKWKHLRKGSFILLVMDAFYDEDVKFAADNGLLTLCTEGCGMDSVLVVNSEDPATYGTVWYLDLANEVGIIPTQGLSLLYVRLDEVASIFVTREIKFLLDVFTF